METLRISHGDQGIAALISFDATIVCGHAAHTMLSTAIMSCFFVALIHYCACGVL
jgi:hypothetical protein